MSLEVFSTLAEVDKERIDIFLSKKMNYSRSYISKLISEELIFVNDNLIKKASFKLNLNDKIKVFSKENKKENLENYILDKEKYKDINVIFEEEDFLAIDKPAGISVHPGNKNDKNFAISDWVRENKIFKDDFLKDENIERSGIVHRLDKDTSGVLLIAKNRKSQEFLSKLFEKREITKRYFALVEGKINKKGIIDYNILRSPLNPTKLTYSLGQGRDSLTKYELDEFFEKENYSSVFCFPKTGRTHQIRVHLSSIGFPILGDLIYGKKSKFIKRQALHANFLEFFYKEKEIKIEAKIPNDIKILI